ncbi:MAG: trigger factor [Patescibacteria group bacterium]
MQITKTVQDKTTVLLKVEVSVEELKPHLEKAAKRISKSITIPGFRPGHAPYDMVKNKAGEMAIYQEAVDDVLSATLPDAVKQETIDFVGKPNVNLDTLAPGNPLVYTATFAIMPKVDLKNYQKVTVKKVVEVVDEKRLEKTMLDLKKLRTKHEPVERAAALGDQVVIDFDIKLAGVSIEGGQGKATPVVLGEKNFIPGFEDALVGMKAHETKQYQVTFPDDYGAKHLAGKQCDVTATVQSVSKVVLPELNDDFAKGLNFASLQELKDQIRQNLVKELEQKAEQKFESEVIEAIIKQADFEPIPQLMLDYEIDRMMEELKEQVEDQGGKLADYFTHIKKTAEELRASWKEPATKRVQGALIIKQVAEQENITVTEDAINAEVERRKTQYKNQPDMLKHLDGLDYRGYVRTILRNEQAVNKLKELAI